MVGGEGGGGERGGGGGGGGGIGGEEEEDYMLPCWNLVAGKVFEHSPWEGGAVRWCSGRTYQMD